jgi:hypothetical protein
MTITKQPSGLWAIDSSGNIIDTHQQYAQLVIDVAAKDKVALIELGARKMAEIVLYEIQSQQLPLAKHIVTVNK